MDHAPLTSLGPAKIPVAALKDGPCPRAGLKSAGLSSASHLDLIMAHSQMLAIAVAAMVAAVLLFRLYTVLGRRTGHEPSGERSLPSLPTGSEARITAMPSDPVQRGLVDIGLADRSFDKTRFVGGARTAYEIIQKAFAAGDRLALRPLLSDEVFSAFEGAIATRSGPAESLAGITDARIDAAVLHGNTAEVTVAFRAQFIKGDVQRDVSDLWTFARKIGASDPNWVLVATSGDAS
jgi:predicted lipid-binding transport protein (Tim44 family)